MIPGFIMMSLASLGTYQMLISWKKWYYFLLLILFDLNICPLKKSKHPETLQVNKTPPLVVVQKSSSEDSMEQELPAPGKKSEPMNVINISFNVTRKSCRQRAQEMEPKCSCDVKQPIHIGKCNAQKVFKKFDTIHFESKVEKKQIQIQIRFKTLSLLLQLKP